MQDTVKVGDLAPEFDLTSTEDVVLMLRDEVPRTAVVLYFCGDPAAESTRRDLVALSRRHARLKGAFTNILAVSPAKLDELKAAQRDLKLPFPLLHDDRNLAAAYGVEPPTEERPQEPALFLVDKRQKVVWMAQPAGSIEEGLDEIAKLVRGLAKSTLNYPRRATNFLVDWWVHRKTSRA